MVALALRKLGGSVLSNTITGGLLLQSSTASVSGNTIDFVNAFVDYSTLMGNTFIPNISGSGRTGITYDETSLINFKGNRIDAGGGTGIYVQNDSWGTIEGNTIVNSGVAVEGDCEAQDVTASKNIITDASVGIDLGPGNTVLGNLFYATTTTVSTCGP